MATRRFLWMVLVGCAGGLPACTGPDALDAWPASLEVRSRASQTGLAGFPVNEAPAVRILDPDGKPVAGAEVTFRSLQGAAPSESVLTTDANGVAQLSAWTLSAGANRLEASIPAPYRVPPVEFTATGIGQFYQIDLSYVTPTTPAQRATFERAAARWELIAYGELTDIPVSLPAEACIDGQPPLSQTVDDLLILVGLDSIDGPGRILGRAGPCIIRAQGLLPVVGAMQFDTADVAAMEGAGIFEPVILHEMAHVMGFGALWPASLGQIAGFNLISGAGGSDPYFTGERARRAFDLMGGSGYTGGGKVPVENTGGPGSRDVHWRESVFGAELMTPFLDLGLSPLSVTSVASMEDMGYLVNYAAGDAFVLSFAPPAVASAPAAPRRVWLENDVMSLPLYVADRAGRLTRVGAER